MEIARYIKSQEKMPSKSIIFIAFNGEEGGLLGSKGYADKPIFPLSKSTVINLDMIGANKKMPLSLMYSSLPGEGASINPDPSAKLRHHLENLARKSGISLNEINSNSSGHAYFNMIGVPAVTLIYNDEEKIHTPQDDMSNIDTLNIDRTLNLVMNFVATSAYTGGGVGRYSILLEEIFNFIIALYPLLIILVGIVIFLYLLYFRKKSVNKSNPLSIPLFTVFILIISLGIVSYFPYLYLYAPVHSSAAIKLSINGLFSVAKSMIMFPLFVMFLCPGVITLYIIEKRINGDKYKGNRTREYNFAYYLAMFLVIISSSSIAFMYNAPLYQAFTPDFARGLLGIIIVYCSLTIVSYLISKVVFFELRIIDKGYVSLIISSLIFFMLLSSFYIPISTNKYIINAKLNGLSIGSYGK